MQKAQHAIKQMAPWVLGSLPFIIVPLVVIGIIMLVFPDWTRQTFMLGYAKWAYLHDVNETYDKTFEAISPELDKQNLSINPQAGAGVCDIWGHSGLKVNIACLRGTLSFVDPTDEFKTAWQQYSPALEQYLINNGWQKEWNADQPIDEVFKNPNNSASVGVNYSREMGKGIKCELNIFYNGHRATARDESYIAQSCSRQVEFFGGYY